MQLRVERSFALRSGNALAAVALLLTSVVASDASVLKGVVVDSYGGALPGAQIVLQRLDEDQVRKTETDAEGSYAFANVAEGKYEVTVELLGFAISRRELTVSEGEISILEVVLDLAIKHGLSPTQVTGVVEDEDGRPLVGARVVALEPVGRRLFDVVESNADGQVVLELEGGQYVVYAYKPCYKAESRVVSVPLESAYTLRFQLEQITYQGIPCLERQ